MQKCKILYSIPGKAEFRIQPGEEETAEDLIDQLSEGIAPTWLETLVKEGLKIEHIEIDSIRTTGSIPMPGEELNFDED